MRMPSLFAATQTEQILLNMYIVDFPQHAVVCRDGDVADGVYFILQGTISVWKHLPVGGTVAGRHGWARLAQSSRVKRVPVSVPGGCH